MLRRLAQWLHKPLIAAADAQWPAQAGRCRASEKCTQSLATFVQPVSSGTAAALPLRQECSIAATAASTSESSVLSPPAQRCFSSSPEFTAAGGAPPQFTAGPDPSKAAGPAGQAAGPQHEAGGAGAQDDDDWAGDVDAILERVQEAALVHVVRLLGSALNEFKSICLLAYVGHIALVDAIINSCSCISVTHHCRPQFVAFSDVVNGAHSRVQQKEKGWSHAALVAGARDVGVSPAIAGQLEKGGTDLVEVMV